MGAYTLGIDLGGTKIFAVVFNPELEILSHTRTKTEAWRGEEEVINTIIQTAHDSLKEAGVSKDQLCAIGIGSPGPLDPDTGVIIESANLKFENFPLGERLSKEFGLPVLVENDVNAATYGEFKRGSARGTKNVIGAFLGTGIGGGLIVDGKLLHGSSKNAGEIGHTIVQAGGPRCGCGRRGCMEAFGSRTGIVRELRRRVKSGEKTRLEKAIKKKAAEVTSTDLKKAYDAGDKVVQKTILWAAKHVGIGLGSLVNALGPEMIVLGGGMIEAFGDDLIEPIDKALRKTAFEFTTKDLKLVRAELGDNAGVIGAALLAREATGQNQD